MIKARDIIRQYPIQPGERVVDYAMRLHGIHSDLSTEAYRVCFYRMARKGKVHTVARRNTQRAGTNKNSLSYSQDAAEWEYIGETPITTLEDAHAFNNVDLDKWQPSKWTFNSWDVTSNEHGKRTNYQVKVDYVPRDPTWKLLYDKLKECISTDTKPNKKRVRNSNKITHIVAHVSDIHTGAEIKDLVLTQNFNIDALVGYLRKAADEINAMKAKRVTINILGDLVESISGLNHPNSWKSMGKDMYGHHVIITAYKIIKEHLLERVYNLKEINILPGNHDRFTIDSKVDNVGGVAGLMAFMIGEGMPHIKVDYNDLVLCKEIDGIYYIMSHGHHRFIRDTPKVVADYGRRDMYNLVVHGHYHTRQTTKVTKRKAVTYEGVKMVAHDEMNYRGIIAPPIFTGNFYSESMGHSSTSGICLTWNGGAGRPKVLDVPL